MQDYAGRICGCVLVVTQMPKLIAAILVNACDHTKLAMAHFRSVPRRDASSAPQRIHDKSIFDERHVNLHRADLGRLCFAWLHQICGTRPKYRSGLRQELQLY